MSYPMLPLEGEDPFTHLPSLSRINNTLLLIETTKNIPNCPLTVFDPQGLQPSAPEAEDSLAAEINLASTDPLLGPDGKKKKGGCTCKKTNCLKNYCDCFSSGKLCTPECSCYGCFNNDQNENLIEYTQAIKNKTNRKSKGCHCKKSQCQKKYCQCFCAKRACTSACQCIDCENHWPYKSQDEESDKNDTEKKEASPEMEISCQKLPESFSSLGLILNLDL